jgi:hypothetical protein
VDNLRFDAFTQHVSTRLTRRIGLGILAGASLPLLRLASPTAGKKKKKVTLCVDGKTVKAPKKKAKKLLKQGATKGACPAGGCPSGQKTCGSGCIPAGDCCVDNDCTGDDFCENGECVALRCGNGGPCAVFVSNNAFIGTAIGGVEGGDQICQTAANNAGMTGRSFRAWLSTATQTPSSRFTKSGPYLLIGNASDGNNPPPTVADDFDDLITCVGAVDPVCLKNAINRTETGNTDISASVWTGTDADGIAESATCTNWTNGGGTGQIGLTNSVSPTWTTSTAEPCGTASRSLYCFEQAT